MSIFRRRRFWWGAALAAALLFALDVSRAPERQLSAKFLLSVIDTYQATLSPLMPSAGVHCRFTPTCSHYAEGAIRRHGALVGSGKAAWRLLRCGPWTAKGTVDPP
ncbi:MAG: membrane protein insertion efficiency factor YidD [Thermoanaerobaculia bacterium]